VLYAWQLPGGLIKIGFTINIARRTHELASRNGAGKLLAIKPADASEELPLHKRLATHCAHGREYYHPAPAVYMIIDQWRAALGQPPIER
jgi:hypothetical protein